jgi:hypothetical protein
MAGLPSGLTIFSTAYDPLDLVATSIDPLGFLKGYLTLADLLLPSLTTVTTVPRYLPMLCAGLKLAQDLHPVDSALEPAKSRARRLEVLRNFEKVWAAACGLVAEKKGEAAIAGLRGTRSVKAFLQRNAARSDVSIGDLNLLSNQVRYGGIGAYTQMLHGCHFIDAPTLSLRLLGENLANAFPRISGWSPQSPNSRLRKEVLREWGARVCINTIMKREAKIIRDGLSGDIEAEHDDQVRWQCLLLLRIAGAGIRSESDCLRKMRELLKPSVKNANTPALSQLHAVVGIIEPFERLYQSLNFIFDELRVGSTEVPGGYPLTKLNRRNSAETALEIAADSESDLNKAFDSGEKVNAVATAAIRQAMQESGIVALSRQISSAKTPAEAAKILLDRHSEVQSGKFDRGQPKGPWVRFGNGTAHATSQRYQLLREDHVKDWRDISRHPYRTSAAGQFIQQCRIE